CQHYYSTPYRF
nr:immunoglobulin light chain junction region [Macaca mulatta]MPN96009.1 immunoglobulin light chain junction region [Macaca mulatta]MPN97622.1 immunoglobulin light chain junction region [Macaca mulatta]MPO00289.1 immunoglobulin light chain junction region [Macaca mulatta]